VSLESTKKKNKRHESRKGLLGKKKVIKRRGKSSKRGEWKLKINS
jgi:hypothetical protein